MATCPECSADVADNGYELGELIVCDECGSELEVTGTEPLTVAPAPMEEEDWGNSGVRRSFFVTRTSLTNT